MLKLASLRGQKAVENAKSSALVSRTIKQFEDGMMAPDYDPEDVLWRPSYLSDYQLTNLSSSPYFQGLSSDLLRNPAPTSALDYLSSTLSPDDSPPAASALAPSTSPATSQKQLQHELLALEYLRSISALQTIPRLQRRGILDSSPLQSVLTSSLEKALLEQPRGHLLLLGSLGGTLALEAIKLGYRRVSVFESSPALFQLARKRLAESDPESYLPHDEKDPSPQSQRIHLYPGPVTSCFLKTKDSNSSGPAENAASPKTDRLELDERADVVLSTMFLEQPHLLATGFLSALDHAAVHLLQPGARVLPLSLTVHAQPGELQLGSSLQPLGEEADAAALEATLWSPTGLLLGPGHVPSSLFRPAASKSINLFTIDTQRRVDALLALAERRRAGEELPREMLDAALMAVERADGRFPKSASNVATVWEEEGSVEVTLDRHGDEPGRTPRVDGVALSFSARLHVDSMLTNQTLLDVASDSSAALRLPAFPQVLHLNGPGPQLSLGSSVRIHYRRDRGHFITRLEIPTPTYPLPSPLRTSHLPWYQLPYSSDPTRIQVHLAALAPLIEALQSQPSTPSQSHCNPTVLVLGCGTGNLACAIARKFPTARVTAVDRSPACVAATQSLALSCGPSVASRVLCLTQEPKNLSVASDDPLIERARKAPADLTAPHDIAVLEGFDCGLLGEGVLPTLRNLGASGCLRKQPLGASGPGYLVVPSAASVFAQALGSRETKPSTNSTFCSPLTPGEYEERRLRDSASTAQDSGESDLVSVSPWVRLCDVDFQGVVAESVSLLARNPEVRPIMEPTSTPTALTATFRIRPPSRDATSVSVSAVALAFDLSFAGSSAVLSTRPRPNSTDCSPMKTMGQAVFLLGMEQQSALGPFARGDLLCARFERDLFSFSLASCGKVSGSTLNSPDSVQDSASSAISEDGALETISIAAASKSVKVSRGSAESEGLALAVRILGEQVGKVAAFDPIGLRDMSRVSLALSSRPQDLCEGAGRGISLEDAGRLALSLGLS